MHESQKFCDAAVVLLAVIRSSGLFFFAVHHCVLEPAEDADHGWVHGAALPLAAWGVDLEHHPLDSPCRAHAVLTAPSIRSLIAG